MITEKTTLGKIIRTKKGTKVLMENGVPCMHCPAVEAEMDTLKLGEVCEMYGLDLKKILDELNNQK